jgi:uncharacterized OB-fold protein
VKPVPTPETASYWEGARMGELRIQLCRSCGKYYFYPRSRCRYCLSSDVVWSVVSGRARLVSYVINLRPVAGLEGVSPVIALVQLDEGPRLMTNIVGVDPSPANLPLDLRLTVLFVEHSGVVLPVFQPDSKVA